MERSFIFVAALTFVFSIASTDCTALPNVAEKDSKIAALQADVADKHAKIKELQADVGTKDSHLMSLTMSIMFGS